MAIAIPAVNRALIRGRETTMRLEINAIEQAAEQYLQKYGDYPPDGSDQNVLSRHMRRLFPRMAQPDLTLMDRLMDNSINNAAGVFSPVAMDRGEAIVFFLGGFSNDVQHPITGKGGPLALLSSAAVGSQNILDYQYNATRDNSFFDFNAARLTMDRASDVLPLLSTDETLLGNTAAFYGGNDPLPSYRCRDNSNSPLLYFDSRTYGVVSAAGASPVVYNGFATSNFGGLRPYKTEIGVDAPVGAYYATEAEAFNAVKFHNPDTYQILSPGMDNVYGSLLSIVASNPGARPVHFVTETGRAVTPIFGTGVTGLNSLIFTAPGLGSKGFQDVDWVSGIDVNGNLDNVTNFTESTLEGALQ